MKRSISRARSVRPDIELGDRKLSRMDISRIFDKSVNLKRAPSTRSVRCDKLNETHYDKLIKRNVVE